MTIEDQYGRDVSLKDYCKYLVKWRNKHNSDYFGQESIGATSVEDAKYVFINLFWDFIIDKYNKKEDIEIVSVTKEGA
jgi:hypothetical protein